MFLKYKLSWPLAVLSALATLFQASVWAQETIVIGEKYIIDSKILEEEREIWIGLPKSYNDTIYAQKDYPVCYFFDGNSQFENFVAQRNWLTRNLYSTMPEVIMVGIVQKDRTNELTPTAMETPKEWKRANFSNSGGNETFMRFIEKELKPYMDATYRTNGFEILSGHSFGGLATIHTFISRPETFDAYIAIDPSLWWDNKNLLNTLKGDWYKSGFDDSILFLAKANDPGSGQEHHEAIIEFHNRLEELKGNDRGLVWDYALYETEDHGSVVVPAVFDALRFIFEGYQMPVKQAMREPSVLDGHFVEISDRLGYPVIPDEKLIDELAKVCSRQELYVQARDLLSRNLKNYPQSGHAKERYHTFLERHKTVVDKE